MLLVPFPSPLQFAICPCLPLTNSAKTSDRHFAAVAYLLRVALVARSRALAATMRHHPLRLSLRDDHMHLASGGDGSVPRRFSRLTGLTSRASSQKLLLLVSSVPVTAAARPACPAKVPRVPRLASARPDGYHVDLGAATFLTERVDVYQCSRRLQSLCTLDIGYPAAA
jgi:hypothetical protein